MCHGGREREQSGFFVLDEGMVWGVSRESQSRDELGSGFLEDHTVRCPHLREGDIKSITWLCPLEGFNNWLMDFPTLTGSQVASGRNLLFKYIKHDTTRLLTLMFLGSAVFHLDFFRFDSVKASHLYWLELRPSFEPNSDPGLAHSHFEP